MTDLSADQLAEKVVTGGFTTRRVALAELVRRANTADESMKSLIQVTRQFNEGGDSILNERLRAEAAEARADEYRDALKFIQAAAASWHGDDAAKGRALSVIADCARAVLSRGDDGE